MIRRLFINVRDDPRLGLLVLERLVQMAVPDVVVGAVVVEEVGAAEEVGEVEVAEVAVHDQLLAQDLASDQDLAVAQDYSVEQDQYEVLELERELASILGLSDSIPLDWKSRDLACRVLETSGGTTLVSEVHQGL